MLPSKIKTFLFKHKIKLSVIFLVGLVYWWWLPSKLFDKPCSTVLVDVNNQLLSAQIASDGQWRYPQNDSLPAKFVECITLFEDEYFYRHPGINPVSIFKSIKRNISSGKVKSGGSTITMQVARMMRGNQSRNYYHKIIEMLLAIRIELSYKKSSILNAYASNAPFGSNVVGLSAASWRYFGRSEFKLSWGESALLAVLPNSPSLIYPGKNHDRLLKKRNSLLKKLCDKKIIDEPTYKLSLEEPLPDKPFPIPQLANHLLNRCINEKGGQQIFRSTINKNLQVQVSEQLNKHTKNLSSNQIHNACALVIETETGNVLAYIGNSYSEKNEHENYVDVISAPRSTGSILKPFLYAFMLNENKILPASLLEDIPTQIGSYAPKNFNLSYDGLVPANQAIARSLNVPAVKMLLEYGTAKFHYRLKQLGFKNFNKPTQHYGLSLILGGGEATLWDISGAYSSMGRSLLSYSNSRNKYAPNNYHPLIYLQNETLQRKTATQKGDVLKASSIWFAFSAMTELIRPQDYVGWQQFLSRTKIAWKTGTSYGFRDAWAVGINAKYTVAVWVGNADGEGRPELTGTGAAAPLMFSIFNLLSDKKWFSKPTSDMISLKVCQASGFKASENCPDVNNQLVPGGSEKTMVCPYHKIIHLDETGKYRVNSNCYSVNKMKHVPWFVVSPIQEYFYKQHSLFYKPLPDYSPECASELNIHQLEIIYPREGFKIYIPVNESGEQGKCILKATHKNNNAILFWQLDENFVGTTQRFHQISILPDVGKHTLSITDNEGETTQVKFEVIGK
ncbi:MAG TPA: penicillin-binding protein 1C [Bacteroidia bacterium]|nr:penicillin-binding protein 1C [Bacteroidia bacterium]